MIFGVIGILAFLLAVDAPTELPRLRLFLDLNDRAITLCYDEFPEVVPYLDATWTRLQAIECQKAKRARPRFCFVEEPIIFIVNGVPGLLYGYYNQERNEILIALVGEETTCNAVHELLHALFGVGHVEPAWSERMKRAGCGELRK